MQLRARTRRIRWWREAHASFLKPLKECTFLPCKKHVEDDITRKIADLGLSAVRKEILEDILGSDGKLEKRIIDSESGEEFLAKVEAYLPNRTT